MEASAGMVAGSHKRNELARIHHDSDSGPKPIKPLNGQICQICGDTVGLNAIGDVFVACNECAFPVCRSCYEYERKVEINHVPSARQDTRDIRGVHEWMEMMMKMMLMTSTMSSIMPKAIARPDASGREKMLLCLHPPDMTLSGQSVSGEIPSATPDTQSVKSMSGPLGPGGKQASLPYVDPRLPVPVRIVDPSKDLNSYGLGSVDWKERVEGWKLKQEKNMTHMNHRYAEGKGGDIEGTGSNGEELQM